MCLVNFVLLVLNTDASNKELGVVLLVVLNTDASNKELGVVLLVVLNTDASNKELGVVLLVDSLSSYGKYSNTFKLISHVVCYIVSSTVSH